MLATILTDGQADGQVGKYTLATFWPASHLRLFYILVLLAVYVLLLALPGSLLPTAIRSAAFALLPLSTAAGWTYTLWQSPRPSVLVMVLFILLQLAGWPAEYLA